MKPRPLPRNKVIAISCKNILSPGLESAQKRSVQCFIRISCLENIFSVWTPAAFRLALIYLDMVSGIAGKMMENLKLDIKTNLFWDWRRWCRCRSALRLQ
jgi:hypothetical protein